MAGSDGRTGKNDGRDMADNGAGQCLLPALTHRRIVAINKSISNGLLT